MAKACVTDVGPFIKEMGKVKQSLKIAKDGKEDSEKLTIMTGHLEEIIKKYDDQVRLAKRTAPKAPKAKPNGKAKAKSAA